MITKGNRINWVTDRREDSAREEDRLENAPSFRDHGWQIQSSAVIPINRVLHETDQETRLCRFLDRFLVGAQFYAHLGKCALLHEDENDGREITTLATRDHLLTKVRRLKTSVLLETESTKWYLCACNLARKRSSRPSSAGSSMC